QMAKTTVKRPVKTTAKATLKTVAPPVKQPPKLSIAPPPPKKRKSLTLVPITDLHQMVIDHAAATIPSIMNPGKQKKVVTFNTDRIIFNFGDCGMDRTRVAETSPDDVEDIDAGISSAMEGVWAYIPSQRSELLELCGLASSSRKDEAEFHFIVDHECREYTNCDGRDSKGCRRQIVHEDGRKIERSLFVEKSGKFVMDELDTLAVLNDLEILALQRFYTGWIDDVDDHPMEYPEFIYAVALASTPHAPYKESVDGFMNGLKELNMSSASLQHYKGSTDGVVDRSEFDPSVRATPALVQSLKAINDFLQKELASNPKVTTRSLLNVINKISPACYLRAYSACISIEEIIHAHKFIVEVVWKRAVAFSKMYDAGFYKAVDELLQAAEEIQDPTQLAQTQNTLSQNTQITTQSLFKVPNPPVLMSKS
ncbi:hypothetical protein PFISCL1PPCAC_27852, partial [Pristionchus fissidentatus]